MAVDLLTIVIPTRDRPDLLDFCLQSIFERQSCRIPVIVSDNSVGTNPAHDLLRRRYPVEYHRQSGALGIVEHQNACLRMPSTRWVILLHDDDELCAGALAPLTEFLAECRDVGIVLGGTQTINLEGTVGSQWLPPATHTLTGEDALLAVGLDWGLRAPGTVYGVQETQVLGGLPGVAGIPADYAHALALAYHYGIAFFPEALGRQRVGHERTTAFETPEKAAAWLSFCCEQAALVRAMPISSHSADAIMDYFAWWNFEALESAWATFDRRSVLRLVRLASSHAPAHGKRRARVRQCYPFLLSRPRWLAWRLFKLARVRMYCRSRNIPLHPVRLAAHLASGVLRRLAPRRQA